MKSIYNKNGKCLGQPTNQKEAISYHLKEFGSITSLEAIQEYGATRLSSIIYDLRKDG